MSYSGHYISDSDVSNFADGATDATKQAVIDFVEERIEKLTKDFFYPKVFGVDLNGNGENLLNLNLIPNILSISSIEVSGSELSASYYTHDKHSVFLDYEMTSGGLFTSGRRNIHVAGTYGWAERLDMDSVSGTFEVGETITGADSEATAVVNEVEADYLKISGRSSTDFSSDEEIVGGTSEATADVDNTNGSIYDPPNEVKEACIIYARYRNDDTLYTVYNEGSESGGGISITTKEQPLTGLREADILIRRYVRKKIRMAIV